MAAMTGLVAYLGPETMLPMTSVIAGVVGVILMLGRQSLSLMLGLFRIKGRGDRAKARAKRAAIHAPHVRIPGDGGTAGEPAEGSAASRPASAPIAD